MSSHGSRSALGAYHTRNDYTLFEEQERDGRPPHSVEMRDIQQQYGNFLLAGHGNTINILTVDAWKLIILVSIIFLHTRLHPFLLSVILLLIVASEGALWQQYLRFTQPF